MIKSHYLDRSYSLLLLTVLISTIVHNLSRSQSYLIIIQSSASHFITHYHCCLLLLQVEWLTDANISTVPVRALVRVWPKGRDAFAEDYSSPIDFDGDDATPAPGAVQMVAQRGGGVALQMQDAGGDRVKIQVTKRKQVCTD